MKNITKKIICLVVCIIIGSSFIMINVSNADDPAMRNIKEVLNQNGDANVQNTTQNVVNGIIDVFRLIALGIAILMLIVLGIKYMTVAPGEKAEYKKSITAYLIGAVILFGTYGLLSIVETFIKDNT